MAHHDAKARNPLHKRRVRAGGWSLGLMLALGGGGGWAQTAAEYGNVAAAQGGAASAAAPVKLAKVAPEGSAVRTPPSRADGPSCSGDIGQPTVVSVTAGKSTLLRLPEPVTRRSLGDASVVEARLVSAQLLYVLGVKNGSTNMILQGKSGKCLIVDVVVGFDTAGLRAKITELLPNETGVKVSSASDSLVLSGVVSDALNANQVVALANAYVRTTSGVSGVSGQSASAPASSGVGGAQGGVVMSPRVVNMMSVAAPQQVMLDVKVAEVSKTILDKLGAKLGYSGSGGGVTYSILSNFLTGASGMLGGIGNSNLNRLLQFDGENKDAFAKVLAEPSLMAISGQEGSFLAGGKLFIPVSQNSALGGAGTITLEEKEFGIGLRFTPTVLSGGRINLKVAPEVSEVNPDGIGVSLNTGLLSGTSILPSITTRRASTTVQLMDGQSFAISGLIKNNTNTNIKAYPWLGQIPVLGALFRSTQFQSDRTELLFVITPHLVKPLPADYKLPTDSYIQPGMGRLFINGKLEGDPDDVPALQQRDAIPAPDVQAPVSDAKPAGGFEVK